MRTLYGDRLPWAFCTVALLAAALPLAAVAQDDTGSDWTAQAVLQRLAERITQASDATPEAKGAALRAIEAGQANPTEAITAALAALHPSYAAALAEVDAARGLAGLQALASSNDPFLAADAAYYQARMLLGLEDAERALPLLDGVAGPQRDVSGQVAAAEYFRGVAQAMMLRNRDAVESFSRFLQQHADAPERLRVSAWQQIQELATIEDGQLGDARQRMDFSRRKLQLQDSGDQTQDQQGKIVSILNKLIVEQEKRECSSCNSSKNCKDPSDGQARCSGKPSNEPQPNASQQGGSSNNPNGVAERTYSDGPASPWSRLRDRARDPAYSAIKDQLPARYRDIVDRYTEKAQGQSEPDGSR